jgi:hypothetical protein
MRRRRAIRGLLTFDDIPRLIARLDEAVRQNIEYRFDGRFSHWALDEFQDTSHAQWAADPQPRRRGHPVRLRTSTRSSSSAT